MMRQTLCFLSFLLSCTDVRAIHVPFGFQSGPDVASSFAGGMVYDPQEHLLYITGATYGHFFSGHDGTSGHVLSPQEPIDSDCFLAVFKLPTDEDPSSSDKGPELLHAERWGSIEVPEACNALAVATPRQGPARNIYTVGHSEPNGLLTRLVQDKNHEATVYGTVTDYTINTIYSSTDKELTTVTANLQGGNLIYPTTVHYPVAITSTMENTTLFVATMVSMDDSLRTDFPSSDEFVDLTRHVKYGSNFGTLIERMDPIDNTNQSVGLRQTLSTTWSLELGASNLQDVSLSSLAYVNNDILLFAGSTQGYGPAFGANAQSVGDYDGFVTKVDPVSGQVPIPQDQTNAQEKFAATYSTRIESLPYQDDFVNGLCHYETDVYVAGTTAVVPKGGSYAFLIKLRLNTLDVEWKREIHGVTGPLSPNAEVPAQIKGIACAVTPNGQQVYLSGIVANGAVLDVPDNAQTVSMGGDDVYVVQVHAVTGNVSYAIQVGTKENESLARGGGVTVDSQGHAILLGNTNGGLLRQKDEQATNDVFFLSVSREAGKHTELVGSTGSSDGVGKGVVVACVVLGISALVAFLYVLYKKRQRRQMSEATHHEPNNENDKSREPESVPAVV